MWCSKRRAEKVMLTFCWLDAECRLVEYEQGRIQSNKVGMVFGWADERNSDGVEQRSTVIYKFGERFACGNPISRIQKPTSQQYLPPSQESPSGVDGKFGQQHGANLMSVSWAGEIRTDSSSSEIKSMALF